LQGILKSYLKKLTNLTSNNRAIYTPRLAADNGIDLIDLDFAVNRPAFDLLADVIVGKREIKLCNYIDSRDTVSNQLSRKLNKVYRKDRLITEERGARDLYIGYPFVHGTFPDGNPIRCPLLLFPVDLELQNGSQPYWKLVKRKDSSPTFNKSFLLAYAHFNKVKITDELLDLQLEEPFEDSLAFRNYLYAFIKDSPLEINFNSDLFVNKLQPFEALKKEDLQSRFTEGQLKLFSEAVLGFFPQAGSLLSGDYGDLIEAAHFEDFEKLFEAKNFEPSSLFKVKEENLLVPFAIDASQEQTIVSVKSGKSLVVQGPPGTGKSQLICNLVADYIARGKKVLVVCQKRAALDVVHARLGQADLQEFVGLVHDFRYDQKALYEQLSTQIDQISEYEVANNSLDAIWLEREFLHTCRNIDKISEELDSFKEALFDESVFGVSVKTLYLLSNPQEEKIPVADDAKGYNLTSLEELLKKYKRLSQYSKIVEKDGFEWKRRKSFSKWQPSDLAQMNAMILSIYSQVKTFDAKVAEQTLLNYSFEALYEWNIHLEKFQNINSLLKHNDVAKLFTGFLILDEKQIVKIQSLAKSIRKCMGTPMETTVDTTKLNNTEGKVTTVMEKFERIDKKFIWLLFSNDKSFIKKLLKTNNLELNQEGLAMLSQKLINRQKFEKYLIELQKITKIELPDHEIEIVSEHMRHVQTAVDVLELLNQIHGLSADLATIQMHAVKALQPLPGFISTTNQLDSEWEVYLTESQISKLIEQAEFANKLLKDLNHHFDSMVEYDAQLEALSPLEGEIFYKLIAKRSEDLITIARNSFYVSWIEEIERRFPLLRSASTPKMTQLENELQQLVSRKQTLSKDIVLLKTREQTYKNLEFNRLNNRITYRDLRHQATKKKKIWKLRKTIAEFKDEVFSLIPCWLASPETVSAIFPLEELFDLVIFDEASQCFAEKGIPSIIRGKQIAIVGDDKQLAPNDLYQPRWEDDDEEEAHPDLEIESLLNLAEKYLPQTMLMGHYRSLSPELIEFSNQHFYKGKLQLLPHYENINRNIPAIDFIKVDGTWEQNSNLVEAEAVAAKVLKLIKSQPEKEIGVVTFNAKQQELISDVMDHAFLESGLTKPEKLFIKNIENVQGDERDIIIFSIGYAPDKYGKMQMQFGSLNQAGGENRLNVAVTRSREKVIIISSIEPEQLRTEESKNEGPKLLKAYLEYAKNVSEGNFAHAATKTENYGPGIYLKQSLSHYTADALPFSDMAELFDGEYIKLIFTDDELYFKALSAKETFAYTPISLVSKQWKYERFFSRNFWLRH
jgi:hypothetical protein